MDEKQRLRSPRYPSFSIVEAEGHARQIFRKDGMNPVDRESAVRHLGYTSLNGASATALASLKQYGLVSDAGKGLLRLTELALDLIEPESEDDRLEALKVAAFKPDLFASLRERFPNTVPSESNLRAHLLRQKFTQSAVKAIIPAYLQTCVHLDTAQGPEQLVKTELAPREERPDETVQENVITNSSPTSHNPQQIVQSRRMIFDTEEGEVVFTFPDTLSEESVDDIVEWFALVAKRLRRSTKS